MMTFLGVPIFEWAGLALALALGVEAWWTIRRKPPAPDGERKRGRDRGGASDEAPPTDRDA